MIGRLIKAVHLKTKTNSYYLGKVLVYKQGTKNLSGRLSRLNHYNVLSTNVQSPFILIGKEFIGVVDKLDGKIRIFQTRSNCRYFCSYANFVVFSSIFRHFCCGFSHNNFPFPMNSKTKALLLSAERTESRIFAILVIKTLITSSLLCLSF